MRTGRILVPPCTRRSATGLPAEVAAHEQDAEDQPHQQDPGLLGGLRPHLGGAQRRALGIDARALGADYRCLLYTSPSPRD